MKAGVNGYKEVKIIDLNARDINRRTSFMKAWHWWDIFGDFPLHYE